MGSREESPASLNEAAVLQANVQFANSCAVWDTASHSSCFYSHSPLEVCSPTNLLAEEMSCAFPMLLQAKSLCLTCVAKKDGLWALECLSLPEEASQACPGSFQGFSFPSPILVVKSSLYLPLSRKVDSK